MSSTNLKSDVKPNLITTEIAARNAIYAMLACNTYHEKSKIYFPVDKAGWLLVDCDGDPTDEATKDSKFLAYDIYEDNNSNVSVIAFRGTDEKLDYITATLSLPISIAYKSANKVVRKYLQDNPSRNLKLVGHSLGGGLALGASVHHGVPAFTFDPSPRIFDGWGDNHEAATRIAIYQNGEILEKIREAWPKFHQVVKAEDYYECNFNFEGDSLHRIDILARELAKFGKQHNPKVQAILSAMGI